MEGIFNILFAANETPLVVVSVLFTNAGPFTWISWFIVGAVLFFMARDRWLDWRQGLFVNAQKRVLLAIDIPREHESSPQVVEQLFAQLWGSYGKPNLIEKWWQGKVVLPYSVEIVSIDGYVQFLIYVAEDFRDLVEASVYAQYPTADIVEVEDYVPNIPQEWPAEGWNMWATEFKLSNSEIYPIRTYPSWEHQHSQKFSDPLAAILETMSACRKGEQIWIQFVITPIPDDWAKDSLEQAKEIAGHKKAEPKKGMIGKAFTPVAAAGKVTGEILSSGLGESFAPAEGNGSKDELDQFSMFRLTPGETDTIKAIQAKATKPAFQTKARFIYVGRNESFLVPRGVSGIIGAYRQYAELSLNAFIPNKKIGTKVNYFFVKYRGNKRRTKITKAYRLRHQTRGWGNGFILNTEELASVWHFPTQEVDTPRVKRAEARKASAPAELPTEELFGQMATAPDKSQVVPSNLPTETSEETKRDTAIPQPETENAPPGNLPV